MIILENITIRQGSFMLRDIALDVPNGCYAVLMGRTGCGKTTLLEIVAGLRRPAAGRILLGGRDVTDLLPAERGVGYVPQDGALFTTMTVTENLAFALTIRHMPRAQVECRVAELAAWLDITHLLARRPDGLSGGERQRVALGRALAFKPQVLLLDEPLSAVDKETRNEMYALLRRAQSENGATVLHITHNPDEAISLANRIYVLYNGHISETDRDKLQKTR